MSTPMPPTFDEAKIDWSGNRKPTAREVVRRAEAIERELTLVADLLQGVKYSSKVTKAVNDAAATTQGSLAVVRGELWNKVIPGLKVLAFEEARRAGEI